jgi:hypothetical protein
MTYKSFSEAMNHIKRTGSAATREHATGRIDMIPADAREPEEYYNTIRDQYAVLHKQFVANQDRLTWLKAALLKNLPHGDYISLSTEYDNLRAQQTKMQQTIMELRPAVRAAGANAWGVAFKVIARQLLDLELFLKINKEVETLFGRKEHEIKSGGTSGTAEASTRRQRRRQTRVNLARKQATRERREG